MNSMMLSEEKIELYKKIDSILISLTNLIDDIVELDENTIGIKLAKNIVIYNEGSCVTINKGFSVQIAKEIHLNPKSPIENEVVNNMLDFKKE